MSSSSTQKNSVPYGSYELRWITPQAKNQIATLAAGEQSSALRAISTPVDGYRCTRVGEYEDHVRKFAIGNSLCVCFAEQKGQYTVIHVGRIGEFERLPNDGNKIPSISARTSLREFLVSKQPASNEETRASKALPLSQPQQLLVNALLNLVTKHVSTVSDGSLTEYYFDEVTKQLSRQLESTRTIIRAEVKYRVQAKVQAAVAQINQLEELVATATARAEAAEAKLIAIAKGMAAIGAALTAEKVQLAAADIFKVVDSAGESAA